MNFRNAVAKITPVAIFFLVMNVLGILISINLEIILAVHFTFWKIYGKDDCSQQENLVCKTGKIKNNLKFNLESI